MSLINPRSIPSTGNIELQGDVWYVDGNMASSGGDGKSWASAYQSLATALAASHADIARTADRQWAGRNTIYVKGDSLEEDLVLFADKTDVIGVGAKDSYDMPCIVGNHVPTNGMSTRFFNIQFRGNVTTGGIIVTLASTSSGIVFNGCHFNGWSTTPATIGVKATASPRLRIENCTFNGAFSTTAIEILAGDANGTMITGNRINSAGVGVRVNASTTCANEQGFIDNNVIYATGLVIDENSDKFIVTRNICVSGGAFGATSHDVGTALSAGNIVTGSDVTGTVPFATIA